MNAWLATRTLTCDIERVLQRGQSARRRTLPPTCPRRRCGGAPVAPHEGTHSSLSAVQSFCVAPSVGSGTQQEGRWHLSSLEVYFGSCVPGAGLLVHPAHTVQACNDLGQNSRAGGPKAAGTTLGWPLGSRGEWVRRLPYYRLSCSIRAFGSPPRGLAFGLPSVTDTAVGCSRTSAPSLQRWW